MNEIINESFPTTGKVPKNLRIFHGSPKQGLKVIKPHRSYSYPELGPVVFASFYKPFAACLCLSWTDKDLRQGSNNYDYNDMSLWLLHDMDFNQPCSIYELVNDGSFKVLNNHPAEIFSPNTIKVKKEERFDSFEEVLRIYKIDLYNFNTKQPLRTYSGLLDESVSKEEENVEVEEIEPIEIPDVDNLDLLDTSINQTLSEHLEYIESLIESNNYSSKELAKILLDLNNPKNEFTFTESVVVKKFIKDKINILENGNDDSLRPYYSPEEMSRMGVFNTNPTCNFYNVESTQENINWFLEYSLSDSIDFRDWYRKLLVEYNNVLKDPSNYNKQKILEMGWNPELEPTIENIIKASKSNKRKKVNDIDIRVIEDRKITAPFITRSEAILNGGFYDNDHIWNSIVEVDGYPNKVFRKRVEVLILDDYGNVYLNKKGNKYRIPGGSTEKDTEDIIQVQNEAKEEARICIKDVKKTGLQYVHVFTKEQSADKWFKDLPVRWDGTFTEVYTAKYDKKYTGKVDILDQDLDMCNNGKFYPIDKVYNILKPEHKKAIDQYKIFNESFTNELSVRVFNEYKKSISDLVPVYIITVYVNSPIAKAIKKVTESQYTHAGISLDSTLDKIFSFSMYNGQIGGGFNIESITKYIKSNENTDMKLMCLFVKKDDLRKIKIALDNYIANIHSSKYSMMNLIYILLNKVKNTKDGLSMVCSQFVDYILRSADIDLIHKPNNLVTPADFATASNPKLYTIYEGKANKYKSEETDKKISKLNKSAKYINEFAIDISDELDAILETYINVNYKPILEYKTFPSVEFSKEGDLLIKNYKKINFEEEYYKSTKLLKIYHKKDNYEAMAYELSKLWFMNGLLEQKIYSSNKKSDLDKYNLIRGKILNTFNRYLKILCENVPDFNFEEYYNNTPFSDTITVKKSTIHGIIDVAKRIIL